LKFVETIKAAITRHRDDALGQEIGQAVVRAAVCSVVFLYLSAVHLSSLLEGEISGWYIFAVSFLLGSIGIVVWCTSDSESRPWRRVLTNVADISAISILMITTGEPGTVLFGLYIWVSIGNGFRFGLRHLTISTGLSVIGFTGVIAFSEYWSDHLPLAGGVMFAIVVLPLYASHLIKKLNLALERAQAANAAKTEFVARMSHELRTPLNGILGSVQLLAEMKHIPHEARELLSVIRQSAELNLEQVGNVLDFSKIEAGKLQIDHEPYPLYKMLNDAVGVVRPRATEKGLALNLHISPNLPLRVIGDEHHTKEILINLVGNAVKFTDAGYVSVLAEHVIKDGREQIHLEVSDTGIGIATEALPRIFDSFVQESAGTTRRYGGSGLGTTICRELTELMNGTISVSSEKGKGTTFSVDLPLVMAPESLDVQGRAILWSMDSSVVSQVESACGITGAELVPVRGPDAAISALARGLRNSQLPLVAFIDATAGRRPDEIERVLECCVKSRVPAIVLAERGGMVSGRALEMSGADYFLPRDPDTVLIARCMHLGGRVDIEATHEPSVIRVEPWAWERGTHSPKILVADDNKLNLIVIQRMLELAGYRVDTVPNGTYALDSLLAENDYALAILDMQMQGIDGPTVIEQYRAAIRSKAIPIIVLTANATHDAREVCERAGASAWLTKPIRAEALLSTTRRLLDEVIENQTASEDAAAPASEVCSSDALANLHQLYSNQNQLTHLVSLFRDETNKHLHLMRRAVDQNRLPAFAEAAHALKGSALQFGATRLAQLCECGQRAGILEFMSEGRTLVAKVEMALEEALAAIVDQLHIKLPDDPSRDMRPH